MKNDAEHLFIYVFATGLPSWVRYMFRFLVHFDNQIVFLLLSFKNSLYTLNTSPSSDRCFENIFFKKVAYLPILLTVFFTQVLISSKFQIIFFLVCAFGLVSKNSLLQWKNIDFLYFSYKFYSFRYYIKLFDILC